MESHDANQSHEQVTDQENLATKEKSDADSESYLQSDPDLVSHKNDKELWAEIENEFYVKRAQTEEYIKQKNPDLGHPPHPEVEYVNTNIFPLLNEGLIKLFEKMKNEESAGEDILDGLVFLSEYLWNMNPNYPQRKENWISFNW